MKVKNKTTGNWDQITLGSVTIDNSLGSDSTTHGASVHAVNTGLAGKISGDGSVEKIVRSETAPTGTEATIWIEPSDFDSVETTILKDTLEDEDLDKAPTVHAVKQAINNVENVDYDSLPVRSKIEYTKENTWDNPPSGYTESSIPYTLDEVGEKVDRLENYSNYPIPSYSGGIPHEYIIGYWYNGKPIYRLVYEGGSTLPNSFTCGSSNVEDVIRMDLLVRENGASTPDWRTIPWLFNNSDSAYGTAAWAGGFYFRATTGTVTVQAGSSLKNTSKFIFILEYTKTIDKPIGILEVPE